MRTREIVNTTVDSELKRLFEATRAIHNTSFGELLDKAMRELLINLNQPAIIDQEIARKENEKNKLIIEQNELSLLKEKIRNLKVLPIEDNNNGNASELIKLRESLFEKSKESIIKLWNKGDINWDSVVPKYKFQDNKEAYKWFKEKIEKANKGEQA